MMIEIERTNKIIQTFNIKNGEELTQLYLKSDVILLADVFENFIKVSYKQFKINPLLLCFIARLYFWEGGSEIYKYKITNITR